MLYRLWKWFWYITQKCLWWNAGQGKQKQSCSVQNFANIIEIDHACPMNLVLYSCRKRGPSRYSQYGAFCKTLNIRNQLRFRTIAPEFSMKLLNFEASGSSLPILVWVDRERAEEHCCWCGGIYCQSSSILLQCNLRSYISAAGHVSDCVKKLCSPW